MNKVPFLFLTALLFGAASCSNSFEKLRTSGDVSTMTKSALSFYKEEEYIKAQTLFELIMPSLKGQPVLEEISFKYAYTHYNLHNYTSANFYFKNFATTFGASSLREEAEYMAAYSLYKQSPNYKLEQESTLKAIDGFQSFVNSFPESKRAKNCNKLIDELRKKLEKKGFEEGNLYFNISQYQAAIQVFENLLKDFPETSDAETVRYTILRSSYLFAENSIYEKQLERFKVVVEKYNDFNEKFPKSRYKREAEAYLITASKRIKELDNDRYKNESAKSGS